MPFKKDPIIIIPYASFASDTHLHFHLRVIEDESLHVNRNKNRYQNIANFIKRIESDEKPDVDIRITYHNKSIILKTDNEGYIHHSCTHGLSLTSKEHYLKITYELLSDDGTVIFTTSVNAFKPDSSIDFGIISDLDDTVIQTGVSSTLKWRLVFNSIFKDSYDRLPLEGVKELYQKLSKSPQGDSRPYFYLSNSPWNLYDYLEEFLKLHNFPKGSIILRDFGWHLLKESSFRNKNKYKTIVKILETYPKLSFILMGDAAEKDADIYLDIALTFPDRISSIFIRTVKRSKRMNRVYRLIKNHTDVNIHIIEKSQDALLIAKNNGLV